MHSEGASAHRPHERSDPPADRDGTAPAEAGVAGVLRLRGGALSAARPGHVDPAAAAARPLEAMGPDAVPGTANARRGSAVGLDYGPVGPWPVASASAPRAGDRAAAALGLPRLREDCPPTAAAEPPDT